MALTASEFLSGGGGYVHDGDGRLLAGVATGGGRTLQFAAINVGASGQTALVAAQGTGLKVKVVSYVLVAGGTVTAQFQSGSTALTGAMSLVAASGVSCTGKVDAHLFETAANTALNINLGGAIQVSGHLAYFVEA